jgi:hypothetical protein
MSKSIFKYAKNHGKRVKDEEVEMHTSTAEALKAHEIGTYTVIESKTAKKAKGKAEAITKK